MSIEELKGFLKNETEQCHALMKDKGASEFILGRLAQIGFIENILND